VKPAPPHVKPKIGRNVLTCWTYAIIIAVLALSAVLYLVAKSGLFYLPLFSGAYGGPLPTRLVHTQPMTPDAFQAMLGERLNAQRLVKGSPPYVIKLTERELTAGLDYGIDSALRNEEWKQVYTQIAVEPTEIEMLSRFEHGWVHLDVLVRFVPRISQGGVMFDPVFVQVGDYKLPPNLTYRALGYLFSRDLGAWILKFGDTQLSAVHLSSGYMELIVASVGAEL